MKKEIASALLFMFGALGCLCIGLFAGALAREHGFEGVAFVGGFAASFGVFGWAAEAKGL